MNNGVLHILDFAFDSIHNQHMHLSTPSLTGLTNFLSEKTDCVSITYWRTNALVNFFISFISNEYFITTTWTRRFLSDISK